jgi:anti-sigma regulatory factor (Ser/Thr protein kinase)
VTIEGPDPSAGEWRRTFDGEREGIRLSLAWIEEIAQGLDLAEDQFYALRLCAEELITNSVLHNAGRARNGDRLHLRLTLAAQADRVALTVEDNGAYFDIVSAPAKTADQPLDQLQPGGLGVGLVKRFASRLDYAQTEFGNKVVAAFHRPP